MTITAVSIPGTVRQAKLGLYSISEAARALGIDHQTLRRMVSEGLVAEPTTILPGGRRRYFREAEVEAIRGLLGGDQK